MRSHQPKILIGITLLVVAVDCNASNAHSAPPDNYRGWSPFRSHLRLGTRLSAGLPASPASPAKQATPAKRAGQERKLIERRSLASGCGDGWSNLQTYDFSSGNSKVFTCEWNINNCGTTFSYELSDVNYNDDIDIRVTDGNDCSSSVSLSNTRHYVEHFKDDKTTHSVYDQYITNLNPRNFCIIITCDTLFVGCDGIQFRFKMEKTCDQSLSSSPPPSSSPRPSPSPPPSDDYSDLFGSCSSTCGLNDNVYYGSCGAFSVKDDSNWCTALGSEFCCGASSASCCKTDGGAVAGLVIGIIIFLGISITACAWCCKCCCFKHPPAPNVTLVPMGMSPMPLQPQVPMQLVQPAMMVQPAVSMQPQVQMQEMPPKQEV